MRTHLCERFVYSHMKAAAIRKVTCIAGLLIAMSPLLIAQAATVQNVASVSACDRSLPRTQPSSSAKCLLMIYNDRKLAVIANNTSLRELLSEISRKTEVEIVGTIPVFTISGHFGPEEIALLFTDLIEGTSTNMIFIQHSGTGGQGGKGQLILTERHGGPTLPNPEVNRHASEVAKSTEENSPKNPESQTTEPIQAPNQDKPRDARQPKSGESKIPNTF